MRGTALDEQLEDVTSATAQAGVELAQTVSEAMEDDVITLYEQGAIAVKAVAFAEACQRQTPVVQEVAGTLRVTRLALRSGVSAPWTQRRRGEHVRVMARPANKRAALVS